MKAAIISALVASVVSVGSATAAFVVTSKNIKNGTIRLIDLSPTVKTGLANKAIQVEKQMALTDDFPHTVLAACPESAILTGGGYSVGGDVLETQPDTTTRAWAVTARRVNGSSSAFVRVYAICLT